MVCNLDGGFELASAAEVGEFLLTTSSRDIMCGRYTESKRTADVKARIAFDRAQMELIPRFNIAPTQMAPVVVVDDGEVVLKPMRWGLIPFWAKDAVHWRPNDQRPGGDGEGEARLPHSVQAAALPGGGRQLLRMAEAPEFQAQTADADSAQG